MLVLRWYCVGIGVGIGAGIGVGIGVGDGFGVSNSGVVEDERKAETLKL